jgi:hypothetical protein
VPGAILTVSLRWKPSEAFLDLPVEDIFRETSSAVFLLAAPLDVVLTWHCHVFAQNRSTFSLIAGIFSGVNGLLG